MCRSVKMYPACGLVVWRCWARSSLASCEVNIPAVLVNKLQCKVLLTKVTATMPESLGEDRSHISSKSPGDRDQVPVLRAVPSGEQRESAFVPQQYQRGHIWKTVAGRSNHSLDPRSQALATHTALHTWLPLKAKVLQIFPLDQGCHHGFNFSNMLIEYLISKYHGCEGH